jgi:hypothetical protein
LGNGGVKAEGFTSGQIENIQKFNNTVGGLAGQGVNYALGGDFTMNALNLSMLGIDIDGARLEGGLFEVRFGREGVSAGIGTGGVNMSYEMIVSTLLGGLNWSISVWSNARARQEDLKAAATSLRSQWGYGDGEAKEQLFDILLGETRMIKGDTKALAEAKTIRDENGKRVVILNGYKDDMTVEEQLMLGINLQHEAYRDGYKVGEVGADGKGVTKSNMAENRPAVLAHTEMALRMAQDSRYANMTRGLIGGNKNLQRDFGAYITAKMKGDDTVFDKYVDGAYDSSEDFWHMFTYSDGSHFMVDDREKDLKVTYLGKTDAKDGEWSILGTQVLEMKGSSSIAQSLY